ncbi:succinic semialdehyde dehydrogenase [mine drainage metagenome]|uniref:Succinic semialdehyde dehydrogenase n=1 Tax=mine drainage metagenome TaxID=410659 RepID=T1C716_9ZZZZ
MLISVNPATGAEWARHAELSPEELDRALVRAQSAFENWAVTPLDLRLDRLIALATAIEARREPLAILAVREMGKRLSEARAELDKCALLCRHLAKEASCHLADEPVATEAQKSLVRYAPLGPLLGIMPWNFPYWQVFRFAAPALAAGNTILLKHAPNVTGVACEIETLFREAGFGEGVFQSLRIPVDQTARVIADFRVRGVSLTGSPRAGRAVAATAGEHLKKCVLELGGSDPWIILADADVEAAIQAGITARFQNGGQSCIAAKRFLVDERIYDRFLEGFVAGVRALNPGDPLDPRTTLAPLAREDLREVLHAQVEEARASGAGIPTGGRLLEGPGFFYAPTVVTDIAFGMRVFREEVFGPAALIFRFRDEREALTLAGATPYGLGASIWSRDRARAEKLAQALPSGMVFVNAPVRSDPRLPFGGIRDSGFGRELGISGSREFVNVRTIWIA